MADQKIKVLVVEDEQMILDMYKLRLEEDGYEVLSTDKGSEAIEMAKTQKPAVILLDVILPETDGFSILQTLKGDNATKDIPILMLTNLGQESDQLKGEQYGAAGYFIKSQHTPAEVLNEIKKVLNK